MRIFILALLISVVSVIAPSCQKRVDKEYYKPSDTTPFSETFVYKREEEQLYRGLIFLTTESILNRLISPRTSGRKESIRGHRIEKYDSIQFYQKLDSLCNAYETQYRYRIGSVNEKLSLYYRGDTTILKNAFTIYEDLISGLNKTHEPHSAIGRVGISQSSKLRYYTYLFEHVGIKYDSIQIPSHPLENRVISLGDTYQSGFMDFFFLDSCIHARSENGFDKQLNRYAMRKYLSIERMIFNKSMNRAALAVVTSDYSFFSNGVNLVYLEKMNSHWVICDAWAAVVF